MNSEEKIQPEFEEEIDLMDYMRVLIKRKGLVLGLCLGAAIVAGILSLWVPKIYRVDTSLEVGYVKEVGYAESKPIEAPGQIVEKINADVYGVLVREKLQISEKEYPEIRAENPKGTNLVKIEIQSSKPELARGILNEINNLILKEHKKELTKKKSQIEENIKEIQKELKLLEIQKVYSDEGIANLQTTLLSLKEKLSDIEPTKIVKAPSISEKPVRPKPLLNVVVAAVLGLFVGVFLAFGKEWWEKNKDKIS